MKKNQKIRSYRIIYILLLLLISGALLLPCSVSQVIDMDGELISQITYGYESLGVLLVVFLYVIALLPLFELVKMDGNQKEKSGRLVKTIILLGLGLSLFLLYMFYNNTRIDTVYAGPGIGMWIISALSLGLLVIVIKFQNALFEESQNN